MSANKPDTIDSLTKILNDNLNRPPASYTKDAEGQFRASVGNLSIARQSPGDGKTRYTLEEIISEGGGVRTYWCVLGRSSCEDMLRAMLDTMRLYKNG